VACINFINLTMSRASQRAREVGLRKVVGSNRRQLVEQFLGESVLFTSFSFFPFSSPPPNNQGYGRGVLADELMAFKT
jgi:ABC-type antimicrobial peptide transport system permease subunit